METPGGPSATPPSQEQKRAPRERANIMGGVVLIVLGLLFLLHNVLPDFSFGDYWPVLLIIIGVILLLQRRKPS